MRLVWKLARAYAWLHPGRMCLTSLATIAAACVVVWVVSGYDALVAQFDDFADEYLGRYDLILVPDGPDSSIPDSLLNAMRRDPAVAAIEPVMQVRLTTVKRADATEDGPKATGKKPRRGGPPPTGAPARRKGPPSAAEQPARGGPPSGVAAGLAGGRRGRFFMVPTLVGTNAKEPPYPMVDGRWIDPTKQPEFREAVLSKGSAEQLDAKVGDDLVVIAKKENFQLKIIGIVEQLSQRPSLGSRGSRMPGFGPGPATAALYVPIALAETISGEPAEVSFVNVDLAEGADVDKFRADWAPRVAEVDPPVLLAGFEEVKSGLEETYSAANARTQAYSATGISLLAALFIIFTTLSMGVSERVRQFAVMRAVGLTRRQVAGLIAVESFGLAIIGWLGGLAAGWGLLQLMARQKPDLFTNGASLGMWCVILTGISALGGALAASLLPAWQATRVHPLDAMQVRSVSRSMRWPLVAVVAGLALIAINPVLVFFVPMADESRYWIYAAVGCTSMVIGFVLLTPLAVLVAERFFGPALARLLGVTPRLLTTQLTSNLWRTLGTTVALTVGLGLFVATQIWGYSMLGPFVPGNWVPDVLVSFPSGGLPDAEIDAIRQLPGVIPQQCLPLAVEQPKLADDITGSEERSSVTRQDNIILIGLDPQVGIGGAHPLVPLHFVEGTREEAARRLMDGRYCIVPDHFSRATGLRVGDRFRMLPPESPEKPAEYTIAGVVSLPGWHWMTKFSGLRRRSGRSAAMVFAGFDTVRRDFQLEKVNFVWTNKDRSVSLEQIGTALQPIAERNQGELQPVNAQGTWDVGARNFGSLIRISTPDEVRSRISARADGMIWGMCQLPLVTLAVTALGVVNTVMASIRARRWEMGILRAVGLTRFGLFRLIVAEALLIGLVACLLSLAFGLMAGWCGAGISQYVSFFGGLNPTLVVPWSKLALGFGATLLLCLAAALWPAITTGRTEPLKLLQAGRAAM